MAAKDELKTFKKKLETMKPQARKKALASEEFIRLVVAAAQEEGGLAGETAASVCIGHCVSHCLQHCREHLASFPPGSGTPA